MSPENLRQLGRGALLSMLVGGLGGWMLGPDWAGAIALVAGYIGYAAFPPLSEDDGSKKP